MNVKIIAISYSYKYTRGIKVQDTKKGNQANYSEFQVLVPIQHVSVAV